MAEDTNAISKRILRLGKYDGVTIHSGFLIREQEMTKDKSLGRSFSTMATRIARRRLHYLEREKIEATKKQPYFGGQSLLTTSKNSRDSLITTSLD